MLLGSTHTDDYSGDVQCTHHGPGTSDVWLLSVSDTTYIGIDEIKGERFKIEIFPNPADEYVKFTATKPDWSSKTVIRIFNNLGQIVSGFLLNKGELNILFDCHTLPSGSYYYTYSNDHFIGNGKIMVTH
jgi:hypothetical protein